VTWLGGSFLEFPLGCSFGEQVVMGSFGSSFSYSSIFSRWPSSSSGSFLSCFLWLFCI